MQTPDIAIYTTDLSVGYLIGARQKRIVHQNIGLSVRRGVLTSLLGANGSGKSTFLKTICGLLPPLHGSVWVDGIELNRYTKRSLSRKIGVVLTDREIDGGLKVGDVVALGRYPYTGFFGRRSADDDLVIDRSMAEVGIVPLREKYMSELSDGERQKVMIAKVLAQECEIIILDEPAAFLDVKSRIEIMNLLRGIAHHNGKTVLMSTHDLELALQLSDRVCVVSKDTGFYEGFTEDVVLSGALSVIFGSDAVAFDMLGGSFKQNIDTHKKVFVNARGENRYWIKNALSRWGFECILSADHAYDLEVRCDIIGSIEVHYQQQVVVVDTIEQMVAMVLEDFAPESL